MIQYLLYTSSIAQMKLSSYANVFKLFLFCSQRMATHHFSWSQIVSWTNLCDKTHFTKQWNHKMERQRLSKDVHPDHSSFFCQWVGLKLDAYLIYIRTYRGLWLANPLKLSQTLKYRQFFREDNSLISAIFYYNLIIDDVFLSHNNL